MIKTVYGRVFSTLAKKPMLLWGLSLLGALLTALAAVFGVLPIISVPIAWVLEYGMASVFLAHCRGEEIKSENLFTGFKAFFRTAGGMGWRALWTFLWSLIPIVGPIFGVIKGYSYGFVPYILLEDKEISATEALRRSMRETDGYKGAMFGAEILVYAGIAAAWLVLGLLGMIPYVGVLFVIVNVLLSIVVAAFLPLVSGLIKAVLYEEITKDRKAQANRPQMMFCPDCGRALPQGSHFCSNCGHRF